VPDKDYHRIYAFKSINGMIDGDYKFIGQVQTDGLYPYEPITKQPAGMWSIDPFLFITPYDSQVFLLFSGDEFGISNSELNQKIYLLALKDPITPIDDKLPTLLTQPDYEWERQLIWVNEGYGL
jgi:hypothetical protein